MHQQKAWHTISVAETLKFFKTGREGLPKEAAQKRLETYGENTLPRIKKAVTPLKIFLHQWESPLILLLVIAAVISFFVGDVVDAMVIIATAFLNALVGFVQEHKANRALLALKEFIQEWATVVRSGQQERARVETLVPGDILVLEAGDKVGADARVIRASELRIDEKVLTGESVPVHKNNGQLPETATLAERSNMCYRGTTVTSGTAHAVVVATGQYTEFGKIAQLLAETPDDATPLQVQITKLGRFLAGLVAALAVIVFVAGLLRGHSFAETFLISVAVAVAAVPEGLVISMTTILAIGMQKILKKNALVRRLVTAETLGSVSVIATDKTGTLTLGEMRVAEFHVDGFNFGSSTTTKLVPSLLGKVYPSIEMLWKVGLLCNNASLTHAARDPEAWKALGDSTEVALKRYVYESALPYQHWESGFEREDELAFTSERKYMAVVARAGFNRTLLVKGAPEVILKHVSRYFSNGRVKPFTKKEHEEWHERVETLGKQGLRLLACAFKEEYRDPELQERAIHGLVFVGIIALKDPLRKEVKEALEVTQRAGVRTIMITGDHPLTARAVGKELGLDVSAQDSVITGDVLNTLTPAALQHVVVKTNIFARVDPVHKIAILKALQANGEVVAMTGDGVNDAPALKGADIGVAVGSGTTIAKETADLILLDDNFKTIVAAVQEGRSIFETIKKEVLYMLANSFSEVILVVGALILGLPLPVLAIQILWVNLIVDSFPNIALAFEPGEREVMFEPPRARATKILDRNMKILVFIIGVVSDFALLWVMVWLSRRGVELVDLRSLMFTALAVNSLFFVFACRSFRRHILKKNIFENPFLLGAVGLGLGLMIMALYVPALQTVLHTTPLSWNGWFIAFSIAECAVEMVFGDRPANTFKQYA